MKMNISWSFSYYYYFVKFHGKKIWEPQHDHVVSNPCYNEVCYKGSALSTNLRQQLMLLHHSHTQGQPNISEWASEPGNINIKQNHMSK